MDIMPLRQVGEGVYYCLDPRSRIGLAELAFLKTQALESPQGRARICAHPREESRRHDMFVALAWGAYARPHRHVSKSESVSLLEGALQVTIFDEHGRAAEIFTAASVHAEFAKAPAFFRVAENLYHVYVPITPCVVFHESIAGPFDPSSMELAPWAPSKDDPKAGLAYLAALRSADQPFSQGRHGYDLLAK